jgi:hypothetical protein
VCCGFLSPLKSIALAGFEPTTFGSNGKHTNNYTTKASKKGLYSRSESFHSSYLVPRTECMEIYIHSPTRLHGVSKYTHRDNFISPSCLTKLCRRWKTIYLNHLHSDTERWLTNYPASYMERRGFKSRPVHWLSRLTFSWFSSVHPRECKVSILKLGHGRFIPNLSNSSSFVRFQVLTAASMMFRVVFWDMLPCKMITSDDGGSTHL